MASYKYVWVIYLTSCFNFHNRQKSSSEIETRTLGQGGQDFEDDSKYPFYVYT